MLEHFSEIFFFLFFVCGGLRLPAPPTGAAPLDLAWFWIEESSRNRFTLNGISAKKNPNIFLTKKIGRKNMLTFHFYDFRKNFGKHFFNFFLCLKFSEADPKKI